jgi:hypothetical protein
MALPTNMRLGWKVLPVETPNLIYVLINYGWIKFCNIGPWAVFAKAEVKIQGLKL